MSLHTEQKAAISLRLSKHLRLFAGGGIRYYTFDSLYVQAPPEEPHMTTYGQFDSFGGRFIAFSALAGFDIQVSQKVRLVISFEYFSYHLQNYSMAPGFDLENYHPENAIAFICGVTF